VKVVRNQSLNQLNTFAVEALTDSFYQVESKSQLLDDWQEIASYPNRLVLGGGSNILFAGDYSGLIIYPQVFGVEVIEENDEEITVRVGASENWHQFVVNMTEKGFFGLENLALIPGTVGASPVQNIGAYGVEVKSLITQVECFDFESGEVKCLSNQECQFAYRDSRFKQAGQGKYLVLSVDFKLSKQPSPVLTYRPLAEAFADESNVAPMDVLNKVCEIRRTKLPDPAELPNAGSFFKNPVVSIQSYKELSAQFPQLVAFPAGNEMKLAAGWLIDNAGLKGERDGNVGTHIHQALVLVNYGEKKGSKIWDFARKVQTLVFDKYGVLLEPEVRVEGTVLDNDGLESVGV